MRSPIAFALAMAAAYSGSYGPRAGVAPPSKKKPAEVQRNRAKAKSARKARKAQRRRGK